MADPANLRPTTLEGVKRLAKRIKRDQGVIHASALEQAARQAGFGSYADARRTLA